METKLNLLRSEIEYWLQSSKFGWKVYLHIWNPARGIIWDFQKMTFKQFLLSRIWLILKKVDRGEEYDYETTPYCGHHYDGFTGKLINEHYWEGIGGGETTFSIFGYKLWYCSEEGYGISRAKSAINK